MTPKFIYKLIPLALAALLLAGCAGASATATSDAGTATVSSVTTTDSITTTGNLDADQLAALTWNTSGVVDKVNVKPGDKVKAGDILASLQTASVPAQIITAQADLASAQRALDDLLNSQSAQANAELAVANAEQAVSDAQIALDSMNYPRASQALIDNTQAKIDQAKRTLAMATDRYRLVQRRPDGDPIKTSAELAMTNAQLNLNTLIATLNWYTGKPTDITADTLRANLSTAKAQLADAQRSWEILKNGPDPVQVASARAKVEAAQATVNNMYVIAPFDGEILTVQTASGDPVANGGAAFEMVNRSTLKIDTLVDETSIPAVKLGNSAEITMDLLPGKTLKGQVSNISAIGQTVNGLVKYTVTIALEPTQENLLFGATANVTIFTSQPHSVLAVPVAAIFTDTQGEYVVQVAADGSTRRVAVTSGDLSGAQVTLTSSGDLKAGDVVELGTGTSSGTNSGGNNGGGNQFRFPGGGPGPGGI